LSLITTYEDLEGSLMETVVGELEEAIDKIEEFNYIKEKRSEVCCYIQIRLKCFSQPSASHTIAAHIVLNPYKMQTNSKQLILMKCKQMVNNYKNMGLGLFFCLESLFLVKLKMGEVQVFESFFNVYFTNVYSIFEKYFLRSSWKMYFFESFPRGKCPPGDISSYRVS
jgi:hypothetical protein